MKTQECIVAGASGQVKLGDCTSTASLLSINPTGMIQSVTQGTNCLQESVLEQSSNASSVPCNPLSNGQHFQIKQIDGTAGKYLLMNTDPATCWEDTSGTLTSYGCHGYNQQIWTLN